MLALGAAPAIVRADSLMKVIPREVEVLLPYSQDIIIDQCRSSIIGSPGHRAAQEELSAWFAQRIDDIAYHTLSVRRSPGGYFVE